MPAWALTAPWAVSPEEGTESTGGWPNALAFYLDFYSFSLFLGNGVGRWARGLTLVSPAARGSLSNQLLCAYSAYNFQYAPCFLHAPKDTDEEWYVTPHIWRENWHEFSWKYYPHEKHAQRNTGNNSQLLELSPWG